ncbi:MAG: PHP domain-containing protein [Cryobacterium sp.]|nr:PHP domain-containing protein [Oligoflexia bacterium]
MSGSLAESLVSLLSEMKTLLELNGENPFKIRAFAKAADAIVAAGDAEDWQLRAEEGRLTEIPGIGKGISQVLVDFMIGKQTDARDELERSLPLGLTELVKVPGLGSKKAIQVIEELDIHSLAELEYACIENRLLKLKGFGVKAQDRILEGVRFLLQTSGHLKLSDALSLSESLIAVLRLLAEDVMSKEKSGGPGALPRVSETGALRRRLETLSELDYLVEIPEKAEPHEFESHFRSRWSEELGKLNEKTAEKIPLPVRLSFARESRFGTLLAQSTATQESWAALEKLAFKKDSSEPQPSQIVASTEELFFEKLSLPWISPEMRETGEEVGIAKAGKLGSILGWNDLQGCFHNHTTRSDGVATLEEMVLAAKARGMKYIGISDHSKSAFYAQGLLEDALTAQQNEIRVLQDKHPEIKIFFGIESDILADGSLDYEDAVLKKFDFVIASVHSRFQMDRTTMTERILQAVRNPRTTMLGHLTGRILLGRKGYDLEIERIIRECGSRGVGIEINGNPARLDIDWRWGPELRRENVMVSVNPDAHDTSGLDDIKYGVCVARKALLPREQVLNTRNTTDVEKWLAR